MAIDNRLSALALPVSVLALVAAVLSLMDERPGGAAPVEARPEQSALEERLTAVEQKLARLRDDLAGTLRAPLPERQPLPAAEYDEELRARVLNLEGAVSRLEGLHTGNLELFSFFGQTQSQSTPADPESVEGWVQKAVDYASTPRSKLHALTYLRDQRNPDGTDARLAVLPSMLALGQTSDSAEVRAGVWRGLRGLKERSMRGPALGTLARDVDASVRKEAAETLASFLPDANVERALRYSAKHDPIKSVRDQAKKSLSGSRK